MLLSYKAIDRPALPLLKEEAPQGLHMLGDRVSRVAFLRHREPAVSLCAPLTHRSSRPEVSKQ